MKILGHQLIDFTPEGQDRPIKFGKLFLGEPIKTNGSGYRVDVSKCSVDFYNSTVKNIPVDAEVEVYYDKYQRVSKIDLIK